MPRKAIDYSNTIIYKLCCNDPTITDIYVGHTTNFTNRKRFHKSKCNNENSKDYNIYVYQFIREHGNWNNWSMIELEKICCVDSNDATKHERRHLELLGATLNSNIPSRTDKEYRIDNADKIKEKDKQYREENKETIHEYKKIYYEENKEEIKEQKKKYREENKEKIKEYFEKNKDKIKEYQKQYTKKYWEENKEKIKEKRLKRLENKK
jgi:hypothetical protein